MPVALGELGGMVWASEGMISDGWFMVCEISWKKCAVEKSLSFP